MNRKRILLCQSGAKGNNSLLSLMTHHFSAVDNVFVNLQLKQERRLPAVAPSEMGTVVTKKRVRAAPNRLFGSGRQLRGYEATFRDIRREAQFSDILVVEDTHYQQLCANTGKSAHLSGFPCPVLVVPAGEKRMEQIILIDDGQPTTYQQIKLMACLFPRLCLATSTTLLIARPPKCSVAAQEERLWIEYLKLHFAHLAVHRVDYQSAHLLPTTVDFTKNALLIHAAPLPLAPLQEALALLKRFTLVL